MIHDARELIETIKNGDDNRLAELIDASGAVEDVLSSRIAETNPTNHAIGRGMTLLQFASYRSRGEADPATVLMERGATIDLHSACGLGLTDRIAEILTANPKAIDEQVDTYFAMQFAITAAQPDAIRCLVQHGDDPNRDLRKVAYFGWEDDVRDQDYTPWKPIHMASLYGFNAARVPVAKALADAGADLDAFSPLDGFRPIHLVAMPNRVDMIRFLIAEGIDVDSRTVDCNGFTLKSDCDGPIEGHGCTPLMVAAAEGFAEATACLMELQADATAKNDRGQTAMDFAAKRFWKGQPYDQVIDLLGR